jgi:hypothetical protein
MATVIVLSSSLRSKQPIPDVREEPKKTHPLQQRMGFFAIAGVVGLTTLPQ